MISTTTTVTTVIIIMLRFQFIIGACLLAFVSSFSLSGPQQQPTTKVPTSLMSSSSTPSPDTSTRRQWFLEQGSALAGAALVLTVPFAAQADVTNKVASTTALRNVKRAMKQAATYESFISDNDWTGLLGAIRAAPMSEVRKNCFILVRGGEDGPDAKQLADTYKAFIASLEKLNTTAQLALRGRQIPDGEIAGYYQNTLTNLQGFIDVAEEAVTIPLQTEEQ